MPDIAGLKLIVPTSVAGSGVSVSASGKVTFTTAATITANGVFSSTYDNYLIVIRSTVSTDVNVGLRLVASGTPATGSDYARQGLFAADTSVTASRSTSQTIGLFQDFGGSNTNGAHLYLYGPALAQPTAYRGVGLRATSGAYIADYAGTHSLSTAYDGIYIAPHTGNMTGALTIYGLAD